MGKVVGEIAAGTALIGGAIAAEIFTAGLATPLVSMLASAGAGMVLSGVGTLLSQKATGIATTSRNPIMPWQVIYGRKKVGGTIVYLEEVASDNRILLLVIALACHECQEVEQLWMNNKQVVNLQINPQFTDTSNPQGFLQSFDPPQGTWQIETISRVNDVVSVTFTQNPNSLLTNFNGQTMRFENTRDSAGGDSFDGYFPVVQTGDNSLTFTCGGPQGAGTGNPGHMVSTWPQYKGTVTVGYYTGDQTDASGIIFGNTVGYWTSACKLTGRTYMALKLVYDSTIYNGLPEISAVVRGKCDIYDPRTGKTGYTNNAALCIADYLAQPIWGFNAFNLDSTQPAPTWTPENWNDAIIPSDQLIAAANICDEQVQLALGGSENRYMCDGAFDVSVKRGEVLQNLLTSCGGRLVYIGGQFLIYPAAWITPSGAIEIGNGNTGPSMMMNSTGLVAEYYNNPAGRYVPDCAGTTRSQFIYAIGLLNAYQAVSNPNAKALAQLILSAIVPYLFRGMAIPTPVTAANPWSPDSFFAVKQAFLAYDGSAISVNNDFASTLQGTWRTLVGAELQTSCDAYNLAIRLFTLAAQIFDGQSITPDTDLGYGLSAYGSSYGDPETNTETINSGWIAMLNAIKQMARIAYQMSFTEISGNTETVINPMYQGGMIPFIASFTGTPVKLNTWLGPAYVGYQSPWAVSQVNPANVANAVLFLAESQATLAVQGTTADTVTVTITGANPKNISLPVEIDKNGNATATFSYAGLKVGTDFITAALASHSLTSNQGEVAWSAYAAPLAVFGVTFQVMEADGTGLFNGSSALLGSPVACQGLMFNSHPSGLFPGDPHQSGNQANPFVNNIVTATGTYGGDITIPNTSSKFNASIKFSLTVETAGVVNFVVYVNSAFVVGFDGGATLASGVANLGAMAGGTALMGYPALAGLNNDGDWPGGNWAVVDFAINFPNPGIYHGEINFASGEYSERQFCMLQENGAMIPNVGIITGNAGTSATGTAPSGQLQLTPYSGGYAIGETATFQIALSGITYTAPASGPFAPVYQFQVPDGAQTWGSVGTYFYNGPDPNYGSGYYQYRPIAELADLIVAAAGTEGWYAQAVGVVDNMFSWLVAEWTSAAAGPPNHFTQSGASVVNGPDVQCAALILYSVLTLDLAARPEGGSGMPSNYVTLLNLVYGLFVDTYIGNANSPMAGTFCTDPNGNQDWSAIWAGEILRALSLLVRWGKVNNQPGMVANATIWIDGLVNFGLNSIVVVDPDLGYTIDDLRAPVTWREKLGRTDLYNAIKGTYISEANQWQQSDVPTYAQDAIHGYTNGTAAHNYDANWDADRQRRFADRQLPFTTSVAGAQRLFKIELMRIRQQGRGALVGMMSMYKSAPLDTIYVSFAPLKWVNKVLEVANVRLVEAEGSDKDGKRVPLLGTEMDIQESDPSVYEWSVTEELSVQGYSYVPGLQNLSPD